MKTLEFYLVKGLYELFSRIPFRLGKYIGHILAFITQHIVRYRKKVIIDNLKRAFPDFSRKELKRTVHEVYLNFTFLWIEWLQSHRLDMKFIVKNCRSHNFEFVAEEVKKGKGLVLYSGHIGNFEWVAKHLQLHHGQVTGIMRRIHNPKVNQFTYDLRRNQGYGVIYTDGAFQKSLNILRKGGFIGVAGDQDAHEKGIFVDFFDTPSSTAVGAALFHLKTGAPIIFAAGIREGWGNFKFIYEKIPPLANNEINDDNIFALTQAVTSLLEKYVRQYPGQYFWTHKRWKSVPNPEQIRIFKSRLEKYKSGAYFSEESGS